MLRYRTRQQCFEELQLLSRWYLENRREGNNLKSVSFVRLLDKTYHDETRSKNEGENIKARLHSYRISTLKPNNG